MFMEVIFSIINALIVSLLLSVYMILSNKIKFKNLLLSADIEEKEGRKSEVDREEELTKEQLKWILVTLPIILTVMYGLSKLGFPVIYLFFGIFYLAFFVAIPTFVFSLDFKKNVQYPLTLSLLSLPAFFMLSNFLNAPKFVIFTLFNSLTITLCFAVLMTSFQGLEINDRLFLLFFVGVLVYDIIAVGSRILVNLVEGVIGEAGEVGLWLFPPIFIMLPGSVLLGLGDIFLLGLVVIKLKKIRNLLRLLSILFPALTLTFFTVLYPGTPFPALPASFLGFVAFLVLRHWKNEES